MHEDQQKELMRLAVAEGIEAERDKWKIDILVDYATISAVVSAIQLACRHPLIPPSVFQLAREFTDRLINRLEATQQFPKTCEMLRLGDDTDEDEVVGKEGVYDLDELKRRVHAVYLELYALDGNESLDVMAAAFGQMRAIELQTFIHDGTEQITDFVIETRSPKTLGDVRGWETHELRQGGVGKLLEIHGDQFPEEYEGPEVDGLDWFSLEIHEDKVLEAVFTLPDSATGADILTFLRKKFPAKTVELPPPFIETPPPPTPGRRRIEPFERAQFAFAFAEFPKDAVAVECWGDPDHDFFRMAAVRLRDGSLVTIVPPAPHGWQPYVPLMGWYLMEVLEL